MKPILRHSSAAHRGRQLSEEGVLHAELLARIQRAAPFPAGSGPARQELEARTRESLRLLRSRKERSPSDVWRRVGERRVRRGPR